MSTLSLAPTLSMALTLVTILFGGGGLVAILVPILGRKAQEKETALKAKIAEQDDLLAQREAALKERQARDVADGAQRDDRREETKVAFDALQKNIDSLQKQVNGQQKQINDQQTQIQGLTKDLETLRNERHELLSQIAALELVKSTESNRANQAEDRTRELSADMCALREQLGAKDAQIKTQAAEIKTLRARRNETNAKDTP